MRGLFTLERKETADRQTSRTSKAPWDVATERVSLLQGGEIVCRILNNFIVSCLPYQNLVGLLLTEMWDPILVSTVACRFIWMIT